MRKEEDTLSRRIAVLILALIFYAICHCCKSMFCGKKEEQIYSAPLVVTSESHTTNIAKTEPGATNLNQKNSQQVTPQDPPKVLPYPTGDSYMPMPQNYSYPYSLPHHQGNLPYPTDLPSTQPTADIPNTVKVNQPAVYLPYPTGNNNETQVMINPPTFEEAAASDNGNSYQKQQSFNPYFKNA